MISRMKYSFRLKEWGNFTQGSGFFIWEVMVISFHLLIFCSGIWLGIQIRKVLTVLLLFRSSFLGDICSGSWVCFCSILWLVVFLSLLLILTEGGSISSAYEAACHERWQRGGITFWFSGPREGKGEMGEFSDFAFSCCTHRAQHDPKVIRLGSVTQLLLPD